MTRSRVIWLNGKRMEVDPDYVPPRPRIHIANSSQEPLQSMADGRWYTCRRQMEREQHAQGFEVVADGDRKYFERPEHRTLDYTEAAARACDALGID